MSETAAWPGSVWADTDYRRGLLAALTDACDARTALENAGRHDLAERVWSGWCPAGVPVRIRYEALKRAGFPFRTAHPDAAGEPADPETGRCP